MVKVQVKPYNTVGNLEKTLGATDLNDNEETTELTLRQLLRPSLISMAISGCYIYDPEFVRTGGETSRGRIYRIFGWFYRMFYFTVCLAGLVQAVVAFFTISSDFIQLNAPKVIFYAQCVCFCLIAWKSNHAKHGGQLKAFAFWDCKISPQMKALGLKPPYEKLKKRQRIYLANAFLLWCLSTGGAVLLSADIFSDSYSSFVSAPFTSSILSLSISVLIQGVVSLTWIISIFYLLTLSTLMTSSFEILNTHFEKEHDSAVIISKFQNLRMLHLNLTKMVTALDKDFGYYLASIFLFSGGIACFILYQILRVQLDGISLLAFTSTLMSVAGLICLASVFAAFVNESAHGCLETVYHICVKGISSEQLAQVNLFLSKLTGTQVGFTTLGLVTITKEFLLTMGSGVRTNILYGPPSVRQRNAIEMAFHWWAYAGVFFQVDPSGSANEPATLRDIQKTYK